MSEQITWNLAYFAMAGGCSALSDAFEHLGRFVRSDYVWPENLPLAGVALATVIRSCIACGAVAVFIALDAVCSLPAAAAVGFAAPQAVELFGGRVRSWGDDGVAPPAEEGNGRDAA